MTTRLNHCLLLTAIGLTAWAARPATACSPAPGQARIILPDGSTAVAVGTEPAIVWVGAFSMCTELSCEFGDTVTLYPGDLSAADDPGGVTPIPIEYDPIEAGLFNRVVRLLPTDGDLTAGTYTLWVEYDEFPPTDTVRSVFSVDGDRETPGVAPPQTLVWYDEQFTDTAVGDSCTGFFDHRLFISLEVDSSITRTDAVWYELTFEDLDGDDFVRAVVPGHFYGAEYDLETVIETGRIIPPGDMDVDCVSLVAVHLEGARSQPLRLCTPTKCIVRDPGEVFEAVDWASLPSCVDDGGDDAGASDMGADLDAGLAGDDGSTDGGDDSGAVDDGGPIEVDAEDDAGSDVLEVDASDEDTDSTFDAAVVDRDVDRGDGSTDEAGPRQSADSGCCAVAGAGSDSSSRRLMLWLALGGAVLVWRRRRARARS